MTGTACCVLDRTVSGGVCGKMILCLRRFWTVPRVWVEYSVRHEHVCCAAVPGVFCGDMRFRVPFFRYSRLVCPLFAALIFLVPRTNGRALPRSSRHCTDLLFHTFAPALCSALFTASFYIPVLRTRVLTPEF